MTFIRATRILRILIGHVVGRVLADAVLSSGDAQTQWDVVSKEHQAANERSGAFFGTTRDADTLEFPECGCSDLDASETCGLNGPIGGPCGCDYGSVNLLNREYVQPLLRELVTLPFFRYFKVDLHCDCPLWADDSLW